MRFTGLRFCYVSNLNTEMVALSNKMCGWVKLVLRLSNGRSAPVKSLGVILEAMPAALRVNVFHVYPLRTQRPPFP